MTKSNKCHNSLMNYFSKKQKCEEVYPAVYAVMSRRTKAAYVILLSYLKSIFTDMNPEESMSDFEKAERQAISEVFLMCATKGCWFHYAQAVWKKHKAMGLLNLCADNRDARKILQMFMCLPLLPADKIFEGFCYLQEQIAMENLTEHFTEMLRYFQSYWLLQVGPSVMSVHGCSRRTNNDVENFNLQLYSQSGKQPHPSLWNFIEILIDMNHNQSLKFLSHENGTQSSNQQRRVSKMQDARIKAAEERLVFGDYNVGEFLNAVSHSVKSLEKRL